MAASRHEANKRGLGTVAEAERKLQSYLLCVYISKVLCRPHLALAFKFEPSRKWAQPVTFGMHGKEPL